MSRMSDQEFARLSSMTTANMTKSELIRWRREFADRNFEEACRAREEWLRLSEADRASITKTAAPILARGWRRAQEIMTSQSIGK